MEEEHLKSTRATLKPNIKLVSMEFCFYPTSRAGHRKNLSKNKMKIYEWLKQIWWCFHVLMHFISKQNDFKRKSEAWVSWAAIVFCLLLNQLSANFFHSLALIDFVQGIGESQHHVHTQRHTTLTKSWSVVVFRRWIGFLFNQWNV